MHYHPHTDDDIKRMLSVLGLSDTAQLFHSIKESLRLKQPLALPTALSELELIQDLEALAERKPYTSFVGAGLNPHFVPAAVDSIIRRSEFYTSYTPYQPEMSQGTLQAIFEFQTIVSELFGLPVANASMYDGASAYAEALLMGLRIHKDRKKVLFARNLHPEYVAASRTYLSCQEAQLEELPYGSDGRLDIDTLKQHLSTEVAVVAVQTPNFLGIIEDIAQLSTLVHDVGALLLVVVTDTVALGLLESPGYLGADIVVGEGLNMLGGAMFGGPAVGLLACKEEFLRQMPGRLCGEAYDQAGQKGYVLTLSTREQHIRRDKATSNICTNQGLIALAYAIHMALLGPTGLKELAVQNMSLTHALVEACAQAGFKRLFDGPFFNEVVFHIPHLEARYEYAVQQGVIPGVKLGQFYKEMPDALLVAMNEMHTPADIEQWIKVMTMEADIR